MKKILSSFLCLLILVFSAGSYAASTGFVKIGDIKGESTDPAHQDWIVVDSWSWGVQRDSKQPASSAPRERSGVSDLTVSVTKDVDTSSVSLMKACNSGQHFGEAKLVLRKVGDNPVEYLMITMKDVLITSVSTGGSGGEDRLVENVTLNFGKVEAEYMPQEDDGRTKPPIRWDLETEKK